MRAPPGLGFAVPFDLVHKVNKTETRHCARLYKTKQNSFLLPEAKGFTAEKVLCYCRHDTSNSIFSTSFSFEAFHSDNLFFRARKFIHRDGLL